MTDTPWKCPKPDCNEGIDAHNLARFLDHMHYDVPEFTSDDAQDVANRVIARVGAALADSDPTGGAS